MSRDSDLRLTEVPEKSISDASASAGDLVEHAAPAFMEEEEDLEVKLRRIIGNVPVRVSNTSGSSAGSGSGDFHQMRRREQGRLSRMDVDYQKRKEMAEFIKRREERLKATEERTSKKPLKRQKKMQEKKEIKLNPGGRCRSQEGRRVILR